MKDIAEKSGTTPWGWKNNVENKNIENPDLLAFLALIIELVDKRKCNINAEGVLTQN